MAALLQFSPSGGDYREGKQAVKSFFKRVDVNVESAAPW